MMVSTEKISTEDYLQLEKDSGERYEYVGGEVRMMAGTTLEHEIGDKFDCYRQIDSLQRYVMIESDLERHDPAMYVRTWKGRRTFEEQMLGLQDTLDMLGCPIKGEAIYESVLK